MATTFFRNLITYRKAKQSPKSAQAVVACAGGRVVSLERSIATAIWARMEQRRGAYDVEGRTGLHRAYMLLRMEDLRSGRQEEKQCLRKRKHGR